MDIITRLYDLMWNKIDGFISTMRMSWRLPSHMQFSKALGVIIQNLSAAPIVETMTRIHKPRHV